MDGRLLRSVVMGLLGLGRVVSVLRRALLAIVMEGISMEPTFHQGDRLLVRRRFRRFGVGDVVALRMPLRHDSTSPLPEPSASDARFIKRVIAIEGDSLPEGYQPWEAPRSHVPLSPSGETTL